MSNIDFSDLLDAFDTSTPKASVVQLRPQVEQLDELLYSDDDRDTDHLMAENEHLKDQVRRLKNEVNRLQIDERRAQNELAQMNKSHSKVLLRQQEQYQLKLSLHESLKERNAELEQLKKQNSVLNSAKIKLQNRLQHKNKDLAKAAMRQQQLEKQVRALQLAAVKAEQMAAEMKQRRQLWPRLVEFVSESLQQVRDWLDGQLASAATKVLKSTTNSQKIRWVNASKRLPAQRTMVLVRNDQESDVALFDPKSGKFKCVHQPIQIKQWAPLTQS